MHGPFSWLINSIPGSYMLAPAAAAAAAQSARICLSSSISRRSDCRFTLFFPSHVCPDLTISYSFYMIRCGSPQKQYPSYIHIRCSTLRRLSGSLQLSTYFSFFFRYHLSLSIPFYRRRSTRTDAGLGNRICSMHEPCLFTNSIICAGGDFFASMAGCFGYIGDLTFHGAGDSGAVGTIERCAISVLFVFGFVCSAPLGPTPQPPGY